MFYFLLFLFVFLLFFFFFFFFFNAPATTEIYTLSLHDALPICGPQGTRGPASPGSRRFAAHYRARSEEHTSELQSQFHLVCRLLLEKKKKKKTKITNNQKNNAIIIA